MIRDSGDIFPASGPYSIRCVSAICHTSFTATHNHYTLQLQRGRQSHFFFSFVTRVRAQGKNVEILHAVEDLIKIIRAHPLYDHLESVSEEEVTKLKKHYNHFMYQVRLRRDERV